MNIGLIYKMAPTESYMWVLVAHVAELLWILTALFANNYYYNNYQYQFITYGTIVWNNSGTHEFVSISLENYIVALFNLDLIRKKISFEALGAGDEIQGYIDQIEECNKDSIRFMREVVSNMDIVMSGVSP